MKSLFLFLFASILTTQSFGQTTTANSSAAIISSTPKEIDWANFENELEETKEPEAFYKNQTGKSFFIDFEILGGKMERLELKSLENLIVYEDNHLFDLPVNTIYELNLEKLTRGTYLVELYTFNDEIIKEQIIIK